MASHYDEFMLTMIGLVLLIIMSELTDCRKALQAIREQMKEDARERGC
jgi:heme exporter protein D